MTRPTGERRRARLGHEASDPPRVALVLASSTGGVGTHVRALAYGLAERGIAVTVHGPEAAERQFHFARPAGPDRPGPGSAEIRFAAVEIPANPNLRDLRTVRRLRRSLTAERTDIVHAHGLRGLSRRGVLAAVVLILHDGVWMAIVAVVGIVIHRVIPVRYRSIVQGALIVTASVTIVALPLVLGFGYHADVPSALPRDYVGGYALVLGAIWLGAVALLVRRRLTGASLTGECFAVSDLIRAARLGRPG